MRRHPSLAAPAMSLKCFQKDKIHTFSLMTSVVWVVKHTLTAKLSLKEFFLMLYSYIFLSWASSAYIGSQCTSLSHIYLHPNTHAYRVHPLFIYISSCSCIQCTVLPLFIYISILMLMYTVYCTSLIRIYIFIVMAKC